MVWQFTTQQPIYKQIVDTLELRIINGVYPSGSRLPSVRDLAVEAAVNPNTMQRALVELEQKGLIQTQRTSGRKVTEVEDCIMQAKQERAMRLVSSFVSQIRALGIQSSQILALIEKQIALEKGEAK